MLKRRLGKTGWDVSAVGLGTWNIGNQWGVMDDKTAESIIVTAVEEGMNLIDTAESYGLPNGLSEMRTGKTLKNSGLRDNVHLVSKIGHWGKRTGQGVPKNTVDMIRGCGHACMGRLRTDYIDIMLCHEAGLMDPEIYIEGFEVLKDEGYVREYGISTDSYEVMKKFYEVSDGKASICELEYSLINRKAEEELLPFCLENDIGVLIRGPLSKGILACKYDKNTIFTDTVRKSWTNEGPSEDYLEKLAELAKLKEIPGFEENCIDYALKFTFSHPANPVTIPGATSAAQVISNVAAGESKLSQELLDAITARF